MRQSRWPRRGKQWVIAVTVALLGTATGCATSTQNQLAADRMVEQRVDGLLRQMTLTEKLQQVQLRFGEVFWLAR